MWVLEVCTERNIRVKNIKLDSRIIKILSANICPWYSSSIEYVKICSAYCKRGTQYSAYVDVIANIERMCSSDSR